MEKHFGTYWFKSAKSFSVGKYPQSVAAADFNGDGKLDLVTANFYADTVSVLLGDGDGSFDEASHFTVGTNPYSVTAADFNGDGKLDLVTANFYADTVSVLLGNGDGSFGAARSFKVGYTPTSVTAADFNGDGKLDLVTADRSGRTVSVLLGNGAGRFGKAGSFSVGDCPSSVAAADFNGDGKLDLVTANWLANTVSVLLRNGARGFGEASSFKVGDLPYSVAAADFNGDGKLDLVTADCSDGTVSVLLGNGAGSFGAASSFPAGISPRSVVAADFNGDGKLDLVIADKSPSTVSVLLGNGAGSFGAASSFTVGERPCSVATADFNGDGKLDLVTANWLANTVSVLLWTAESTSSLTITTAAGSTGNSEQYLDGNLTNGQTLLHKAAEEGKVEDVISLIDREIVDVNAEDDEGRTALLVIAEKLAEDSANTSAKEHYTTAFNALIEHKADVNLKDHKGQTPVHVLAEGAGFSGNDEALRVLVSNGANITAADNNGQTPLHKAVKGDKETATALLIEKFENKTDANVTSYVNAKDNDGRTPLHEAVELKIIKLLVSKGANVNAQSVSGWTPLHEAIFNGDVDRAAYLIEAENIDINANKKTGWTPLTVAQCIPNSVSQDVREKIKDLLTKKGAEKFSVASQSQGNKAARLGLGFIKGVCTKQTLGMVEKTLGRALGFKKKTGKEWCDTLLSHKTVKKHDIKLASYVAIGEPCNSGYNATITLGECNICEPYTNPWVQVVEFAANVLGCTVLVQGGATVVSRFHQRLNFLSSWKTTLAITIGCAVYQGIIYDWGYEQLPEEQRLINAITSVDGFSEYQKKYPATDKRICTVKCLKEEKEIHNFLDNDKIKWYICHLPKKLEKLEEIVKAITSIEAFNDFEDKYGGKLGYHLASACSEKEEQVHSFIEAGHTTLHICLPGAIDKNQNDDEL